MFFLSPGILLHNNDNNNILGRRCKKLGFTHFQIFRNKQKIDFTIFVLWIFANVVEWIIVCLLFQDFCVWNNDTKNI